MCTLHELRTAKRGFTIYKVVTNERTSQLYPGNRGLIERPDSQGLLPRWQYNHTGTVLLYTPVNRGHWREGFPAEGENLTMVPVLLSQRVLLMMNQLGARTVRSITTHTVSLQKWPPTNKRERQNYSLVTRSLP